MEENSVTRNCELLVIGGSAGSMEVIIKLLPQLSSDINFPIIILLHRRSVGEVTLSSILNPKTVLEVKEAEEKESLNPGVIYIAPPDYHLLLEKDRTFSLDYSERIHYCRPSIDVTFESAADVYADKLACLLLSGANADGVAGLAVVHETGGIVAVQDPDTAEVAYMPQQAIKHVAVNYILKPNEMGSFVNRL